jgi:nicotinate-nucleotide adenylyltransferase
MRVGLFFGSFNPVHVGHMALANYMLEFTDLQQVWLVVSPQNPHKKGHQMLSENNRLLLVNLAIDDHPNMRSSNIEFTMSQPSYTIHTLVHLKEKYPEHEFSLIMGQDNLQSFDKWKNYEQILEHFHIYVYPRPGAVVTAFDNHAHVHLTSAPLMDISSTFIRQGIREKKDLRFFVPAKVWEEIDVMNFYRNLD